MWCFLNGEYFHHLSTFINQKSTKNSLFFPIYLSFIYFCQCDIEDIYFFYRSQSIIIIVINITFLC